MTGTAWAMLLVTWTVVFYFTSRFLLRVLRTPARDADDAD